MALLPDWLRPPVANSNSIGFETTSGHPRLLSLHCEKLETRMSAWGLGCAKTPAPAAHVEPFRRNCASWSRMMLRAQCSIPCWRIVFSTFRDCMSFYTARVNRDRGRQCGTSMRVRFAPKATDEYQGAIRRCVL